MLADSIAAIVTALNAGRETPVPSYIGEKHRAEHGTPPRLVWIPVAESFGPAKRIGANPIAVRTRLATVECEVWGADMGATEQLINDLIYAAHGSLGHAWYEVTSGTWKTEGELRAHGYECVLQWRFEIPVVGPTPTRITPDTYTTTTSISTVST